VFGEDVNPRLRKLRDGLDALGLPTDDLLNHGGPRLVYGVALAHNARAYLLGRERRPQYILPQGQATQATRDIARWWAARWLLARLRRGDVLERIAQHHHVYPLRHGARVELPLGELA
jgi:hypothetical protein